MDFFPVQVGPCTTTCLVAVGSNHGKTRTWINIIGPIPLGNNLFTNILGKIHKLKKKKEKNEHIRVIKTKRDELRRILVNFNFHKKQSRQQTKQRETKRAYNYEDSFSFPSAPI